MSIAEPVLSTEERDAVAAMAAQGPAPRAAAIDALRFVQAQQGYVSDAAVTALAAALDMPAAALDEVATFYNLIFRQKVGAHVIMLCDSVACWMLGRDALQARILERLGIAPGETSADGRFSLLPIVCLGACDKAPALLMDGALHGDVDDAALAALLDKAR
jgi:NADH-quinone oxidoreductase subunit E